jgi:hypothetical protein
VPGEAAFVRDSALNVENISRTGDVLPVGMRPIIEVRARRFSQIPGQMANGNAATILPEPLARLLHRVLVDELVSQPSGLPFHPMASGAVDRLFGFAQAESP